MAPEAIAFGVIGAANLGLYILIYNALIFIGAIKATVIATLVTTYLAYLANRHWTYKDRPRRTQRREYTLFFAVNMVGLLIQAAGNGALKYGFGLTERGHWLAFNLATAVCIAIATLFRFWTYRTFVFVEAPAEAELPVVAPAEGLPVHAPAHHPHAPAAQAPAAVPASREPVADRVDTELEQLTSEVEFAELTGPLEAELTGADQSAEGAARIH
jgi:putative flippase GtrA